MQRSKVTVDELGPATLEMELESTKLSRRKNEKKEDFEARLKLKARASLTKRGEGPFTLLRSGFPGTVSIPVTQFKWLVRERKLHGYSVRHFIYYSLRDYLSVFIKKVLLARHLKNLAGEKRSLQAMVLKLLLNRDVSQSVRPCVRACYMFLLHHKF